MFYLSRIVPACLLLLLGACGGSADSGNSTAGGTAQYSIELAFSRLDNAAGLDPFQVTATIRKDGQAAAGLQPQVQLQRGTRNAISDLGDGRYRFTVTPAQTGEHRVTVSYQEASSSRTALVLKSVHPDWGQPMAVEGLVNTEGYEDGLTVSPDGQHLFTQTSPQYFSALFVFLEPRANGGCGGDRLNPSICRHPWLDTLPGPYTAPERPGFFDGRFSGNTFLHNSSIWQLDVDQVPIFAFATMFYGFKKQADGRFAEPFYIAFDDLKDAIANPFGMSFRNNPDGSLTMVFAHDDGDPGAVVDHDSNAGTAPIDSRFDIYTLDITPGQNTSLGSYISNTTPGTPPLRGSFFPSRRIDLGSTGTEGNYGTQGNPHLYVLTDGSIHSIWTDDEHDANNDDPGSWNFDLGDNADLGDLSVYTLTAGSFPDGSWQKTVLPATINAGGDQIQPFFTGQGLFYTQDTSILYAAYNGARTAAGFASDSNWMTPVTILQKDAGNSPTGKIIAIGEPTIASDNGKQILYFIYGYVRAIDAVTGLSDTDLQAGYVERRLGNTY